MRTSSEMFTLFMRIANADERIRVMTLEGSRVNPNVTPDVWQDYDITFLVTDVESFKQSDEWLEEFGNMIFMQKPEAMELFPPDFPDEWFSYLMLFSDGIKIDLTLVPYTNMNQYFAQDPLIRILLDKDGTCPQLSKPSDARFWVQKPCMAFIHDCANEFFFVCTYIAKGLLRNELLFANWMFEQNLRVELLRMLGYLAGVRNGFPLNTGKYNKRLLQFLTDIERDKLFETYILENTIAVWNALYTAMNLFENSMIEVCESLSFDCPNNYMINIKEYIETIKAMK